MARSIGGLAVEIGVDIKGFITGLDKADRAVEKFSSKLDRRLLQPIGKVAAAASAAAAGMFLFADRVASAGDTIEKTSKRLGLSVTALSELRHAADVTGVKVTALDMGLQRFTRRAAEAANGTGEAKAALEEMGIQLRDQNGRMRTSDELLGDVAEAFKSAGSQADRVRLAFKLFDSEGVTMLNFLGKGRDGLNKLRQEAHALGRVWTDETAKAAVEFKENVRRLEGAAEGLSIQLAGPLIEALSKAADSFLKTKVAGESMFDSLIEGWRTLWTGDDVHKWNKQMVELTGKELEAFNKLQRAKQAATRDDSEGTKLRLFYAQQEYDAIKKQLDLHRKTEALMKGTELFGKPKPPPKAEDNDDGSGGPKDPGNKKYLEEFEKRQKILDDAQQAEFDTIQQAQEAKAKFLQDERDQYKALQDEKLQILYAAIDAEQEAAIEAGEERLRIDAEQKQRLLEQGYTHQEMSLGAAKTFFGSMTALMNTNSKTMFEIGKKAAIAETIINTYDAAMGAYKALAGIPIIGPALGAAAAAAAVASGMAQVRNIQAQQIGGSAAAGTFQANPNTGAAVGTPAGNVGNNGGEGGGGPTRIVHFNGDRFDRSHIRELIREFNEAERDGGRIQFAQ